MKNFKFVKVNILNAEMLRLVAIESGDFIGCIEEFQRQLISMGDAVLTAQKYARIASSYIDFTVELIKALEINPKQAECEESVLELYLQMLNFGRFADSCLVRHLAIRLGQDVLEASSLSQCRAALKKFFMFTSKSECSSDNAVDEMSNEVRVLKHRNLPKNLLALERRSGHKRFIASYLAECISGGVEVYQVNNLPNYFPQRRSSPRKELRLNFEEIEKALAQTKSPRDRCLYALLASGGSRISEAVQVLREDIDIHKREVRIVDPRSRKKTYLKMGVALQDFYRLRFKGRTVEKLFMIEPFATYFWESYAELLVSSELPVFSSDGKYVEHSFVFCVYAGQTKGRPLCFTDQSNLRKRFARDLRCGELKDGSFHDLRHSHVSHVCNEIPNGNGYGLGVDKTCSFVGHVNKKSTEGYNHLNFQAVLDAADEHYAMTGYYEERV